MNLFSSPHSFFPFISSKLKPLHNLFKVQYKLTLLLFQFRPQEAFLFINAGRFRLSKYFLLYFSSASYFIIVLLVVKY